LNALRPAAPHARGPNVGPRPDVPSTRRCCGVAGDDSSSPALCRRPRPPPAAGWLLFSFSC